MHWKHGFWMVAGILTGTLLSSLSVSAMERSLSSRPQAAPRTAPPAAALAGERSVAINEWALVRLSATEARLFTRSIATCVGVGGLDPRTGTAFLTHLLYYDGEAERSQANARQILGAIRSGARKLGIPEDRFELVVAGSGFTAGDFGEKVLEELSTLGFRPPRADETDLGGPAIRAIEVSRKGPRIFSAPSASLPSGPTLF